MDEETGTARPEQEAAHEKGERVFLLVGDDPLPEGVHEDDEGVFVIRLVGPTPEEVEAHRVALMEAENVAY